MKPRQYGQEYAGIFGDESVVAVYHHRPPYHPDTFPFLASLIPPSASERVVLDAGCGTGYVARPLATLVGAMDAVDIAPAMITEARRQPGGDRASIHWQVAPIETAVLRPAYSLIVAAASIHWMDWEIVFPRFARHLMPGAVFAMVGERHRPYPWDELLKPIYKRYSQNTDYGPYDLIGKLQEHGLFRVQGQHDTPFLSIRQPIDAWVESVHARNGFSRDRMDPTTAREGDAALRAAVLPFCRAGRLPLSVSTRITWGLPLDPSAA